MAVRTGAGTRWKIWWSNISLLQDLQKDENYFKEMYLKDIENKWDIDLSALSNEGKAAKRFDFVVKTESMIYAVETNFTAAGARS